MVVAMTNAMHSVILCSAYRSRRSAFTLVEVLLVLLVLSIGMLAALGMVTYGLLLAKLSVGRSSGLATAMTVAVDATPAVSDPGDWIPGLPTASGYVNGYYVTRTETPYPAPAPGMDCVHVSVDVYETLQGRLVASYDQNLIKQAP